MPAPTKWTSRSTKQRATALSNFVNIHVLQFMIHKILRFIADIRGLVWISSLELYWYLFLLSRMFLFDPRPTRNETNDISSLSKEISISLLLVSQLKLLSNCCYYYSLNFNFDDLSQTSFWYRNLFAISIDEINFHEKLRIYPMVLIYSLSHKFSTWKIINLMFF